MNFMNQISFSPQSSRMQVVLSASKTIIPQYRQNVFTSVMQPKQRNQSRSTSFSRPMSPKGFKPTLIYVTDQSQMLYREQYHKDSRIRQNKSAMSNRKTIVTQQDITISHLADKIQELNDKVQQVQNEYQVSRQLNKSVPKKLNLQKNEPKITQNKLTQVHQQSIDKSPMKFQRSSQQLSPQRTSPTNMKSQIALQKMFNQAPIVQSGKLPRIRMDKYLSTLKKKVVLHLVNDKSSDNYEQNISLSNNTFKTAQDINRSIRENSSFNKSIKDNNSSFTRPTFSFEHESLIESNQSIIYAKILHENGQILYEGETVHGEYNGKGRLYNRNKKPNNQDPLWNLGEFVIEQTGSFWSSFEGSFQDNLFHGFGNLYLNDSLKLNGFFNAGKAHGRITIIDKQRNRIALIGHFKRGLIEEIIVNNL